MSIDECFQTLELKPDATMEELKAARNELLQVWHPDKFASNLKLSERAKEKTQKINEAFLILIEHLKVNSSSRTNSPPKYKSNENQNPQKAGSPNQKTEEEIYRSELKRIVKKQEARLEYNERRKEVVNRAKRQLNYGFLATFFIGVAGLIMGLKELTLFPVLIVLIISIIVSFLTYRKPVKKK